jgi:hypothetical protein
MKVCSCAGTSTTARYFARLLASSEQVCELCVSRSDGRAVPREECLAQAGMVEVDFFYDRGFGPPPAPPRLAADATRAHIHDGTEYKPLQSEAGYIDARPQSRQIDENLLRRTTGPYIGQIRLCQTLGPNGMVSGR